MRCLGVTFRRPVPVTRASRGTTKRRRRLDRDLRLVIFSRNICNCSEYIDRQCPAAIDVECTTITEQTVIDLSPFNLIATKILNDSHQRASQRIAVADLPDCFDNSRRARPITSGERWILTNRIHALQHRETRKRRKPR